MTVADLITALMGYNPNSNVYIRMVSPHFGTETHSIGAIREETRPHPSAHIITPTPTDIILEWIY